MDFDPQLIQSVLSLGEEDPQAIKLKRQQRIADQLRAQSMDPLQGQMAGRVFVPASALQGVANVVAAHKSQQMQPGIDEGMQGVTDRRINARKGYVDAVTRALRRQAPVAPQAPSPLPAPDDEEEQGPYSTPQAGY